MMLCRVIAVTLIGLVVGGCALRLDEPRLAAELEPILQPVSEAATAAGVFHIEYERWPIDAAELQAFATERDLPFRAEVLQQLDMHPQPDGSLLMNFEVWDSGNDLEEAVQSHGAVRVSPTDVAHTVDCHIQRVGTSQ